MEDCSKVAAAFVDNPLNVNEQEIGKCIANHKEI